MHLLSRITPVSTDFLGFCNVTEVDRPFQLGPSSDSNAKTLVDALGTTALPNMQNATDHTQGIMPPRLPRACGVSFAGNSTTSIYSSCHCRSVFSSSRPLQAQWPLQYRRAPRPRKASTVAPVTVVNAVKHIPAAALELYEALENLRREGEVYTSLSQLQLALRGLESENAVTRIACGSPRESQLG